MRLSVSGGRRLAVVVAVALGAITADAAAQPGCEHGCLPTIPGVPGVDDQVLALASMPDGDIIAGGLFSVAGDVVANHIARFDRPTRRWSTLSTGLDDTVRTVVVTPDGTIVAGGDFQNAGDEPTAHVAMFDFDKGAWTALGPGVDGVVYAMSILPTGELVVGGDFDSAGKVQASNIAVYNFTTGEWSALGTGTNRSVLAVQGLANGDILAGGLFFRAGGEECDYLARWDASEQQWVAIMPGLSQHALAFELLPEGDVIVGGSFFQPGGYIVRYSPADDSLTPLAGGGVHGGPWTGVIRALTLMPDNKLVVGGHFLFVGSPYVQSADLAVYDLETDRWSVLNGYEEGDEGVCALLPLSSHEVCVAAAYRSMGEKASSEIAALNLTDESWEAFGIGTNDSVGIFAGAPDGRVIVGGDFSSISGLPVPGLALYDPTSANWTTLGPPGVFTHGQTKAALSLASGDVLVAGRFTLPSGEITRLAIFNPPTETWSFIDTKEAEIEHMVEVANGDIIMAGDFLKIGEVAARGIVRYTPETNVWTALAGDFGGVVDDLELLPDGDVMVCGSFSITEPIAALRMARYRPASDTWLGVGNILVNRARSMVVHGYSVIATGDFRLPGQPARFYVARYDTIAGTWSRFADGLNGVIYDLAALSNGDVVFVGLFPEAGGAPARNAARYSPSGAGTWSAIATEMNQAVDAVFAAGDALLLGGRFTLIDGDVAAYFHRIDFPAPTCPTDINADGVVNSQDFFDFLNAFFATTPPADFNRDDVVNSQDFFDFVAAFFAGC